MNCVWIVKQTPQTVWNSLVKGQSHKVHRLSSLAGTHAEIELRLEYFCRYDPEEWAITAVRFSIVLAHLFKNVSHTGNKEIHFSLIYDVLVNGLLPKATHATLKVSILYGDSTQDTECLSVCVGNTTVNNSSYTICRHLDMIRFVIIGIDRADKCYLLFQADKQHTTLQTPSTQLLLQPHAHCLKMWTNSELGRRAV